ncbi:MAG: hydrogenase iron-sulfur subunit [Thermodesulfobacteriota bacterium]|nr:hydrogenase iron-sulfur subunit [Thermodesulfobacteriota bacterium]
MEKVSMNKDVLVIGGQITGAGTAVRLADAGYNVIFAKQDGSADNPPDALFGVSAQALADWRKTTDQAASNNKIEVLDNTRLTRAAGVAGDYSVRLANGKGVAEKTVGAVVVTTDEVIQPLDGAYGVTLSDKVLTQTQLEEKVAAGAVKGMSVGFLSGFGGAASPLAMQRIFRSVLAILSDGGSASVYVNDLKLADNCLDRLYKEGRDKGAVYFKMKECPAIEGTSLTFQDTVLGRQVTTEHDLLVIDEALAPNPLNLELAEVLGLHRTPSGFLQKDNVHRFPVNSNREGIFVVGPARHIKGLTDCVTDMDSVLPELKMLFATEVLPTERIAVVDREKCAICLTCYRCCPHGAIYWDDKAIISPVACQGCGICASECPQEAIQIEGFSDDDINARVKDALKKSPEGIIAFCCENSAVEAARAAQTFGMDMPETLQTIPVPCAGKVDINYILTAFVEGASGVLVVACHDGNCKSEFGSNYARWRAQEAARMLEETGFDKNRLAFVTLAANMGADFADAVNSMRMAS